MTDNGKWDIDILKQFTDERLSELERRGDERLAQLNEQMRIERESIDKRFEAANRYKETYSETLNKLGNETLRREEVNSRFTALQEKIDTLGRTNWPLYSSFGGIAISMVVGLWVIIGLKIDATNQPVIVSLEQSKISNETRDKSVEDLRAAYLRDQSNSQQANADLLQKSSNLAQQTEAGRTDRAQLNDRMRIMETQVNASQQADANSKTDRNQLNNRVHELEGELAASETDRKSTEASLRASLTEVESQLCANDDLRNIMHAFDLRTISLVWQRLRLGNLPTDNAYYPIVCNKGLYPISK